MEAKVELAKLTAQRDLRDKEERLPGILQAESKFSQSIKIIVSRLQYEISRKGLGPQSAEVKSGLARAVRASAEYSTINEELSGGKKATLPEARVYKIIYLPSKGN